MSLAPHGKSATPRLVVFGCGYVGSTVAAAAIARGIAVTALTRNAETAQTLRAAGMEAIVADAAGTAWHDQVAPRPEYIVNCLGAGDGGIDGYRHSYVGGMTSIVRWARERGEAGTIVYTSSTSVYPQGGGVGIDESAPTWDRSESESEGENAAEPAGRSGDGERGKILVEAERRLVESGGAFRRWFVLRAAGIYGPGRHHLLDQVRAGVVAGAGDHHLNLVHRDDLAAAIWACFQAPATIRNQVFNVADDGAAPKREIAEWLAAAAGVSAPAFSGAPAGTRRVVPPDRVILNAKIKSMLGWRLRFDSFRQGYDAILGSLAT